MFLHLRVGIGRYLLAYTLITHKYLFAVMKKSFLVLLLGFFMGTSAAWAQTYQLIIKVSDEKQLPIEGGVVELFAKDNKTGNAISKKNGEAVIANVKPGVYELAASFTGYEPQRLKNITLTNADLYLEIKLKVAVNELAQVTVQATKPFIQREQGKLIVNPDASPTNNGTTVVELLEKSPGVMIDRNNGISLRNKSGVLVLIDDKPTYLQGADLITMLSSMNTSQVEKIELITNPSAKYDAAGNSGIINIKTKKVKQIGFNGNLTMAAAMGVHPRTNNSLLLNYRKNKWSHYFSYGINYAKTKMTIYALRTYFNAARSPIAILEQPTVFNNTNLNNTLKYGTEFAATDKLSFVFSVSGSLINRKARNTATADWLSPSGTIDSSIFTSSKSENRFTTGTMSIGSRHKLSKTQQLTIDADAARYDLNNEQYFQSDRTGSQGYTIGTLGNIPSLIKIFSVNSNYTQEMGRNGKLEAGIKTSKIDTDNDAGYAVSMNNGVWKPDYGKSNHFIYGEKIHAAFGMYEQKFKKLTVQAGLRYEYTHYDAHQLGNVVVKDSSFSRNYDGFFPSGFVTWEADSAHTFSVSVGRRIDRPNFQRLNPFVNIINKYTLERGNPFFRPQFTWNFELSHQYKQLLHTTISYSLIRDYFSQLFLTDPDGSLVYTQGNVGRMHNYTFSMMLTTKPAKWWSLNTEAIYTYKKLIGYVWNNYRSDISQLTFNMNNQFRISKKISAELSGTYTGRSRNDLQELLYPFGQLNAGFSMPVMKNSGTLRLSFRDIFKTFWMEGLTDFKDAEEYFIVRRDSRVITASFSYRFGKTTKAAKQKSATEEMRRVEL